MYRNDFGAIRKRGEKMPSTYAHYRLGQKVRGLVSDEQKSIIESYPELFDIGLHGPDILFYYKPLKSNSVNRIGYQMHEKSGRKFFERAKKVILRKEEKEAYLAYIYGVLCHFALDVSCHSYIDQKINASGVSHAEIEVEFDRALMIRDGYFPITHKLTGHIVPSNQNAEVIREFYGDVTAKQVKKALKSMTFYNNLLIAPSRGKRKFVDALLKVSGNYKEMHGLMVNYEENPKCADSTKKLKELYDDAVVLATSLITEYPVCMHGKCILSPIYNYSFGGQYIGGAV